MAKGDTYSGLSGYAIGGIFAIEDQIYQLTPYAAEAAGKMRLRGGFLTLTFESIDITNAVRSGSVEEVTVQTAGAYGAWEGALAGGKFGAYIGGPIGALAGPEMAPVGAFVGGVIGAIGGATYGEEGVENAVRGIWNAYNSQSRDPYLDGMYYLEPDLNGVQRVRPFPEFYGSATDGSDIGLNTPLAKSGVLSRISGYHPVTPHCFPAGTPIRQISGIEVPIECLQPGDNVAAFDGTCGGGKGPLQSRRIVRVFENITTTWLRLSNGLTVTPGHHFLDSSGSFSRIDEILASDGRIVEASGQCVRVTAEYIHYSEENAGLFEQAEGFVLQTEGGLALAPVWKKGWKTYNFEVENFHTYVAAGIRVHNTSNFYNVATGDTLSQIAAQSGTTVSAILHDNPQISDPDLIYAGEVIDVPHGASSGHGAHSRNTHAGSGPEVTIATGKTVPAGTHFSTGSGDYVVRSDGSTENTRTHQVYGNGQRRYNPDTNKWETIPALGSTSGSSSSSGSSRSLNCRRGLGCSQVEWLPLNQFGNATKQGLGARSRYRQNRKGSRLCYIAIERRACCGETNGPGASVLAPGASGNWPSPVRSS